MRSYFLVAISAIVLANVATSSDAATVVRDHRTPPVVRDHRQPVEVRDHRRTPEVRDHRGDNGGVTVTSRPRPKKKKACLLGVVCTSNETVVGIADKTIPNPVLPR